MAATRRCPSLQSAAKQIQNPHDNRNRPDDYVRRDFARGVRIQIAGQYRMLDGVAPRTDVLLAFGRRSRLDHRDTQRQSFRRERQDRGTDFDLVAFSEGAWFCEYAAIYHRRIYSAGVEHEFPVLQSQLGVVPRYGRLANEDMACGIASDRQ